MKVTPSTSAGPAEQKSGEPLDSPIHSYCRSLLASIGDDAYVREGLLKLRRSVADAATLRGRMIDFMAQDGASTNRLTEALPQTLSEQHKLLEALSADFLP